MKMAIFLGSMLGQQFADLNPIAERIVGLKKSNLRYVKVPDERCLLPNHFEWLTSFVERRLKGFKSYCDLKWPWDEIFYTNL